MNWEDAYKAEIYDRLENKQLEVSFECLRCGKSMKRKVSVIWDEELKFSNYCPLNTCGIGPPICADCVEALSDMCAVFHEAEK